MATSIIVTHEVRLSLTDALTPPVIHMKQYDSTSRKVLCSIYNFSTFLSLTSSDVTVTITGAKPDGYYFNYRSDVDTDVVFFENGKIGFWITDVMTTTAGKVPVDVTLVDGSGNVIGAFYFIFRVQRVSVENDGVISGSYSSLIESFAGNITNVYIDDDGYLIIETEDGLGISFSYDSDGNIIIKY